MPTGGRPPRPGADPRAGRGALGHMELGRQVPGAPAFPRCHPHPGAAQGEGLPSRGRDQPRLVGPALLARAGRPGAGAFLRDGGRLLRGGLPEAPPPHLPGRPGGHGPAAGGDSHGGRQPPRRRGRGQGPGHAGHLAAPAQGRAGGGDGRPPPGRWRGGPGLHHRLHRPVAGAAPAPRVASGWPRLC